MDPWVDPTDPAIIEAITGDASISEGVEDAVAVASEILTMLTGFRGHAAGTVEQEHVVNGALHRLTPTYRPVLKILSVESVSADCTSVNDISNEFYLFAGDVRPVSNGSLGRQAQVWVCNSCGIGHERIRLRYDFGSTVGASAKRAVINMSRQMWLYEHPEAGECILPERVVSLNREGLSYSFIDPMNFLDAGRTGIPSVDIYLATMNPSKAKVPAAVYIPESPPGVPR
jgi:hypothetical protein